MKRDIGKLCYKIQIWRETLTPDNVGGFTRTVALYASPWADIYAVDGSENYKYNRVESTSLAKFVIRYRSDLSVKDEIRFKGKSYNISDLGKIEHNRESFLWILATEGVAQ